MMIIEILVGIFLLIGGIFDWKTLSMPGWLLVLGVCEGVVSAGYLWISNSYNWLEMLWALLPGGISLLLAFATREQLGYGDGLVLLVLGSCLGPEKVLWIWMLALLGSFAVSIVLLVMRKATKSTRLPFVPFLFLGYIVTMGGGLVC